MRGLPILAAVCLYAGGASASDLTIPLPRSVSTSEQVVLYQCDPDPSNMGLPKSPFPVTYLDAGENHLAVIEIRRMRLIFVRAGVGSSARYVNGLYSWWDAPGGQGTFLAVELPPDLGGMQSILCQRIDSP
ncbi:MAG: MliC family protein [Acetobacteraceae bacterium]|nr:MliC family protein [Acetobacteraceae bacterium]